MMPNILLIEDELLLISALLPTMQGRYQIAFAQSVAGARTKLENCVYDAVLLDLDLGERLNGVDLIPEIKQTGAKIIIVSARYDGPTSLTCLRNGIHAFLDKRDTSDSLIPTIEKVLAGHQYFPEKWLATLGDVSGIKPLPPLDRTEIRIMDALCQEPMPTNPEISDYLHLSESRIKNCLTDLYEKFEIKGRVNLVMEARRRGYLPNLTPLPVLKKAGGKLPAERHG